MIAAVAGAVGSLVFMFASGPGPPVFLLLIFCVWVPAPFIALIIANVRSARWRPFTQNALFFLTLSVTLGSFAVYQANAVGPRKPHPAFVFVALPPAACLLIVVVLTIASLSARRSDSRASDR